MNTAKFSAAVTVSFLQDTTIYGSPLLCVGCLGQDDTPVADGAPEFDWRELVRPNLLCLGPGSRLFFRLIAFRVYRIWHQILHVMCDASAQDDRFVYWSGLFAWRSYYMCVSLSKYMCLFICLYIYIYISFTCIRTCMCRNTYACEHKNMYICTVRCSVQAHSRCSSSADVSGHSGVSLLWASLFAWRQLQPLGSFTRSLGNQGRSP